MEVFTLPTEPQPPIVALITYLERYSGFAFFKQKDHFVQSVEQT